MQQERLCFADRKNLTARMGSGGRGGWLENSNMSNMLLRKGPWISLSLPPPPV